VPKLLVLTACGVFTRPTPALSASDGPHRRPLRRQTFPWEVHRPWTEPLPMLCHPMPDRRFFLVLDEPPCELVRQLVDAASNRAVQTILVRADQVDPLELPQLGEGDLLYRVGTSHRACMTEQLLFGPGVAAFYEEPFGPHHIWDNPMLVLSRQGVPVPAATFTLPTSEAELRSAVAALGGLPVILKRPGHSLGEGVMRLDTWPSLRSVVDAFRATVGDAFVLMAYVAPAVHWRLFVLDGAVVASYLNPTRDDDFRSHVVESRPELFTQSPSPATVDAAVRATRALGLRFGGVDLLVHDSGQPYVLEVNFPAYFGHPKQAVGLDVASLMLEALLTSRAGENGRRLPGSIPR
jgi:hypothetical protein